MSTDILIHQRTFLSSISLSCSLCSCDIVPSNKHFFFVYSTTCPLSVIVYFTLLYSLFSLFFFILMCYHIRTALRLLALRELIIILYLYSGLRSSVRGKITSENGNLMNLRYTKMKFDNIIFGISAPDYPSRTVESNSLLLFWISIYLVYFIFI